jgi:hypothetical protein
VQTKDQLIAELTKYQTDQPYAVSVASDVVTIELDFADAKWYTLFQQNNLTKSFKVTITLNEAQHTALVETQEYELTWSAGVPALGSQINIQRGEQYSVEFGKGGGIRQDGSVGQVYNYKLNSAAMLSEIKGIIKQAGWKRPKASSTKIGIIAVVVALLIVGVLMILLFTGKFGAVQSTSSSSSSSSSDGSLSQ